MDIERKLSVAGIVPWAKTVLSEVSVSQDTPPGLQELLHNDEMLEIYHQLPPAVMDIIQSPALNLPTEFYRVILLGWRALTAEEQFETLEQLPDMPLQSRLMLLIRRTSEAQLRQP